MNSAYFPREVLHISRWEWAVETIGKCIKVESATPPSLMIWRDQQITGILPWSFIVTQSTYLDIHEP